MGIHLRDIIFNYFVIFPEVEGIQVIQFMQKCVVARSEWCKSQRIDT